MKKVKWRWDHGCYVPLCPYCNDYAYEKDHCVFCNKKYKWVGKSKERVATEGIANNATATGEWISVDERLPERLVDVLVCYSDGAVNIDFRLFTTGGFARSDVTHWMPLPEPPKMKGGA